MLTRIEVKKTYWLGMSGDQKLQLIKTIALTLENDEGEKLTDLGNAGIEVLNDVRQALLNA